MTIERPLEPNVQVRRWALRNGHGVPGSRSVPEETAVAFTYNRSSYAVMMATPSNLEDFAIGFSLSEGIVAAPAEIKSIETVQTTLGLELRMELADEPGQRFSDRRRHMAGPVGCGLCGIESLKEAMRAVPSVTSEIRVMPEEILSAVAAVAKAQTLNHSTRAVHAAAFWMPEKEDVIVREDVGRHNALDKLAGAVASQGIDPSKGVVIISSRVSVEMVQKAAMMGASILVAVSAPTALAIRTAEAAGLTLVAIARDDGFEVFVRPDRIQLDSSENVA